MSVTARRLPALLVLTAAALAALLVAVLLVRVVEARSRDEVGAALRLQGHDWAQVATDGLLVRVSGLAPSEAARFRALSVAGTVVDSGRLQDEVEVAEAAAEPPAFSIELLRTDRAISLIGLLPEGMDRDGFSARVARIAGGATVTDLLESADHPIPKGWTAAADFALLALDRLPRSKVSVSPGRVVVKAAADSPAAARRLEAELRRSLPEAVALQLEISAPRPAITPFTLRFLVAADGAARFDACSADTEPARARILAAAGLAGPADCAIGIGAPSPRWAEAAELAIRALKELGGGSLTISDADVSLVALESADRAQFDTVTGTLENRLPEPFSLTAVLPQPVETDGSGEGAVPELVATLLDSGQVILRGRVRDEAQMKVIAAVAQGLYGVDRVQNALRLDAAVPQSWVLRSLTALQGLRGLGHGRALVQADYVEIAGVTGNPELQSALSRLLAAKLGEGANFRIEALYDKKLDPVLGLPTAEECVAELNAAQAGQKILFAPGSAEIEPGAGTVLDRIGDLLRNCADYPIEIGGHTDSQGRESMNQELSQARAESVVNALMARRVLTGNLTARGYGESLPIADNGTEEGREANRRIEFRLVGADEDAPQADAGAGADDSDEDADEDAEAAAPEAADPLLEHADGPPMDDTAGGEEETQ